MERIRGHSSEAWTAILDGWIYPTKVLEDGTKVQKPEREWTKSEHELSTSNRKALLFIHELLDLSMYQLVKNHDSSKDAGDILERTCEGSKAVKRAKVRTLTPQFHELRMGEHEDLNDYLDTIMIYVNERVELGEPFPNSVIYKKNLHSLNSNFKSKVLAIDARGVEVVFDYAELIENLQNYDLSEKVNQNPNISLISNSNPSNAFNIIDRGDFSRSRHEKSKTPIQNVQELEENGFPISFGESDDEEEMKKILSTKNSDKVA